MLTVIRRRLLLMIPVLFIVSLMVFAMIHLVPGDAAVTLAGENATIERIEEIRRSLGLNDPLIEQYGRWIAQIIRGDFGTSLYSSQQVLDTITTRLPATVSLAAGSLVLSLVVGVPAGILAAINQGRLWDKALGVGSAALLATPSFFIAMLLILFFAIKFRVFPATSYVPLTESPWEWFRHLILPWITLSLAPAAVIARQLRSSLIGVLSQDYIRTARAKGLLERVVILKHACKNAAIPVVTAVGAQVAAALGGTVIIEQVFGIPGVGRLAVQSVMIRDIPMIQGVIVMTTLAVLLTYLLVDIAYGYLNPRIRVR